MKRVLIVGGGVSGLVCAYAMRQVGVEPTILEPNKLGGEFLAGGLKYIHETDDVKKMFDDMGLAYSDYSIQGGILLRNVVQPYPKCLGEMAPEDSAAVQADHYRKTRRSEPGDDAKRAMNDPASTKPRKALRCDFFDMVRQLSEDLNIIKAGVKKIEAQDVITSDGVKIPYDYCVVTIPLWALKWMVNWYVPEGVSMRLNLAQVTPRKDRYASWDYVYTPYTPDDVIHRISQHGSGYSVEANGILDNMKLHSDLNFIFPEGWTIEDLKEGLKGHLLPLQNQPDWPGNIAPLGRFAQWDPRATTDTTLEEAKKLTKRWFGE